MTDLERRNKYTCQKCKRHVITVDRDKGVTPFMILCVYDCGGMMHSSFYRVDTDEKPRFEWYKPKRSKYKKLSPGEIDHCKRGGLLMREIK